MDENKMRAMIGALKLDALESLLHEEPRGNEADAVSEWFDTLRKQAIVIECEVEHHADLDDEYYTTIHDAWSEGFLVPDKVGIQGKALVIIVSLEEKDE